MYSDEDFIKLIIDRLDLFELIDILSPDIEDAIDGLRPLIMEKRHKIEDYLDINYEEEDDSDND